MAKINSDYFLRKVFAFLELKKQLQLIIYNKHLQNKLNLNLINYKIFSGKYIIYENETNTKGKIINAYNNMVYYDGEFLKGKKHGKGKEYYDYGVTIKLKFEGEYLNGKRNGKGKEYDIYGNLIYEGEYKNGERHGKGKEYYYNGKLRFEGEYLYGRKWNIKEYDINCNIIYELKNGKGFIKEYGIYCDFVYMGEYLYGLKNGKGKYLNNETLLFEGEFLNGFRNGKGKEFNDKGNIIFEGEYLYSQRIKGKEYVKEILEYEGEYLYDRKYNGKGYDEKGNITYELINGNGKVKEFFPNSDISFEGEYLNGKKKRIWKII